MLQVLIREIKGLMEKNIYLKVHIVMNVYYFFEIVASELKLPKHDGLPYIDPYIEMLYKMTCIKLLNLLINM